jgi:hypothetical protein
MGLLVIKEAFRSTHVLRGHLVDEIPLNLNHGEKGTMLWYFDWYPEGQHLQRGEWVRVSGNREFAPSIPGKWSIKALETPPTVSGLVSPVVIEAVYQKGQK